MPPAANIPEFGKIVAGISYVERPGAYGFFFNPAGEMAVVQTSLGLFLPGGGVDSGETHEQALARELSEEIGWELISARLLRQANQYHWSEFYQKHFKKIGSFFLVDARPVVGSTGDSNHMLHWLPPALAERKLSQEFQRWAVAQGFAG